MSTESPALWVKLSATLDDDPRIIEAGPLAELLWLRLLRIAKRSLSDGIVSEGHLRKATADLPGTLISTGPDPIAALQDVGLLRKIDAQRYELAGWLDWNPSRGELQERRAATNGNAAERTRRYRARRAHAPAADQLQTTYEQAYATAHGGATPPPSWNARPHIADLLGAGVETATIEVLLGAAARENKHPRVLEHLLADYQRDRATQTHTQETTTV